IKLQYPVSNDPEGPSLAIPFYETTSFAHAPIQRSFSARKPHLPLPVTEAAYLRFINEVPPSKFIHAAPSRASGQNHPDCEPSVFDCKPLHLVRPFPQRMKSWPIYRQGQPSFDE
ncbi:hypothetical protein ACSO21_007023, partial [Pseudomonas aeruginosa]